MDVRVINGGIDKRHNNRKRFYLNIPQILVEKIQAKLKREDIAGAVIDLVDVRVLGFKEPNKNRFKKRIEEPLLETPPTVTV